MAQPITSEDRQVLVNLLGQLHRRLNGVVDTGSALCLQLGAPLLNPPEFVAKQMETIRALTVVIRSLVGEAGPGAADTVALVEDSRVFGNAFAVLASYQAVSEEDLRRAAHTVGEVYRRMVQVIDALEEVAGRTPVSGRTAANREYYEGILGRLFDVFHQARQAGDSATAAVRS